MRKKRYMPYKLEGTGTSVKLIACLSAITHEPV